MTGCPVWVRVSPCGWLASDLRLPASPVIPSDRWGLGLRPWMTLMLTSWARTACRSQPLDGLPRGEPRPLLGEGPLRWDWGAGGGGWGSMLVGA